MTPTPRSYLHDCAEEILRIVDAASWRTTRADPKSRAELVERIAECVERACATAAMLTSIEARRIEAQWKTAESEAEQIRRELGLEDDKP